MLEDRREIDKGYGLLITIITIIAQQLMWEITIPYGGELP
jgi:hypothetical protein